MICVIITGVSTGIGAAVARHLCRSGCKVIGSVRRAEDASDLAEQFGDRFIPLVFDVTDEENCRKEAQRLEKILDPGDQVKALINNAGIATGGPLLIFSAEELRHQLDVNVVGVHRVIQCFFPILKAHSTPGAPGRIINISSVAGRRVLPFMGPYSASKYALEAWSDALRMELIPHGLEVVLIEPGPVQSAIWTKKPDSEHNPYIGSEYEPALRQFESLLIEKSRSALPAEKVAVLTEKILRMKKPKARYLVTRKAWKNYYLMKILPTRLMDRILVKVFRLERFESPQRSHNK